MLVLRSSSSGLTLIEVLVAAGVLGGLIVAFLYAFSMQMKKQQQQSQALVIQELRAYLDTYLTPSRMTVNLFDDEGTPFVRFNEPTGSPELGTPVSVATESIQGAALHARTLWLSRKSGAAAALMYRDQDCSANHPELKVKAWGIDQLSWLGGLAYKGDLFVDCGAEGSTVTHKVRKTFFFLAQTLEFREGGGRNRALVKASLPDDELGDGRPRCAWEGTWRLQSRTTPNCGGGSQGSCADCRQDLAIECHGGRVVLMARTDVGPGQRGVAHQSLAHERGFSLKPDVVNGAWYSGSTPGAAVSSGVFFDEGDGNDFALRLESGAGGLGRVIGVEIVSADSCSGRPSLFGAAARPRSDGGIQCGWDGTWILYDQGSGVDTGIGNDFAVECRGGRVTGICQKPGGDWLGASERRNHAGRYACSPPER